MTPGTIEVALNGILAATPERRTSAKTGRDWVRMSVACDEMHAVVLCFGPAVEIAASLAEADRVYVEGKIRPGETLTVMASLIQPMGRIGERKPKRTQGKAPAKNGLKCDPQAPIEFADGTAMATGDALPF